ncbi:hypothetical protein ACROYT_G013103 [Oculina patagonica]
MAEQRRFGVLSSCLMIAWVLAIGSADDNTPEKGQKGTDPISGVKDFLSMKKNFSLKFSTDISVNVIQQNNNNTKMTNKTRSSTCTPAHLSSSSLSVCEPYVYGEKGVCSSVIGDRLIYGSIQNQVNMERLLVNFRMARAYVLSKDDISERCLKTVELIYCNHYFQRCDNSSSTVLPVPVCREACDVMVQQHCKEEFRRAREINKAVQGSESASRQWAFDLINCTALPKRNGGTIPECYYPRELEGNLTKGEFSETCSYGDGQTYRGNISVTRSGYTCQSWSSQCPHRHHRTLDNYPELVNAGNACRNPGGQAPRGPWCYTTNASMRWEYCNISTCSPEDATLSDWSPFTNCSVPCGRGFKTRYRTCNGSRFGGKDCASLGALTERQPCINQNCSGPVDIVDVGSDENQPKGLTFVEITIVSAGGSVLFILVVTLVAILLKRHRGHNPNIQDGEDKEEITPYATVRLSGIFGLSAESNPYGFPGMYENPLKALPFQPRTPLGERRDLRKSPYENIDHLGRSSVNPLEHLFFKPRYENEALDNEPRDVIMIKPGYDKLAPGTRKKRRENGGAHLGRRLPCGMVDTHGRSVYDSLIREIDLKCRSRRVDITDSESEDDKNIHTILEEPSCDERSPACSMDRKRNEGSPLQGDIEVGCIGNDWKNSQAKGIVQPLKKESNGNLSPRSQAAFKMEDLTGLFEFYSSGVEHEQSSDEENTHE